MALNLKGTTVHEEFISFSGRLPLQKLDLNVVDCIEIFMESIIVNTKFGCLRNVKLQDMDRGTQNNGVQKQWQQSKYKT